MSEETSAKPDSIAKPYPEAESSSEQVSKVAEGVAAYIARPTPKPRAAARAIAGLAADDEVWAFVKANNLLPSLENVIRLVRETFLTLQEIKLA